MRVVAPLACLAAHVSATTCQKADFSDGFVHNDATIRPFGDLSDLIVGAVGTKVMIGSNLGQTSATESWSYDESTKLVKSAKKSSGKQMCWSSKNTGNKQQDLILAKCNSKNKRQRFKMVNGRIHLAAKNTLCVMFNTDAALAADSISQQVKIGQCQGQAFSDESFCLPSTDGEIFENLFSTEGYLQPFMNEHPSKNYCLFRSGKNAKFGLCKNKSHFKFELTKPVGGKIKQKNANYCLTASRTDQGSKLTMTKCTNAMNSKQQFDWVDGNLELSSNANLTLQYRYQEAKKAKTTAAKLGRKYGNIFGKAVAVTETTTVDLPDVTTGTTTAATTGDVTSAQSTTAGENPLTLTYGQTCGRYNGPASAVIGGTDRNIKNHGYHAALYISDGNMAGDCGGTIIGDQWILTAAHCLQGVTPKHSEVIVGSGSRNSVSWSSNRHDVKEFIQHPQYNDNTLKNDIGLIKLKWGSKIQFSEKIYPACLPAVDMCLPEGTDLTVTGFGATKENGNKLADILQGAEVPIFNHDTCGDLESGITEAITCAGGNADSDACSGDSGGPLAWKDDNQIWTIYGLVSAGPMPCRELGRPALYTRVSHYLDWIKQVTGISMADETDADFKADQECGDKSLNTPFSGTAVTTDSTTDTTTVATTGTTTVATTGTTTASTTEATTVTTTVATTGTTTVSTAETTDVTTADGTSTSADNSLALTYGQTCGKWYGPTSAIIGGTNRQIKDHGYHAALETSDGKWIYDCGGAIIGDQWILTAAHCMEGGIKAKYSFAITGTNTRTSWDQDVHRHRIHKFIMHPNYNKQKVTTDVGLAKLKWTDKIVFSEKAYPICLPSVDMCLSAGTHVTATGFGATKTNGNNLAHTMKGIEFPIFDHDECVRVQEDIDESFTCAGGQGDLDICDGDSGGPLAWKDDNDVWTLYGTLSTGTPPCASKGYPSMFNRVSYYIDWVKQETGIFMTDETDSDYVADGVCADKSTNLPFSG